MSETKKLLVAFDPENPKNQSSDFLIPIEMEGETAFYGLNSRRRQTYGLMVYLGRSITESDLFAKLVDSGAKVASVNEAVSLLRQYIEKLQSLRIGNVVRIQLTQSENVGFELELVSKTPRGISHG